MQIYSDRHSVRLQRKAKAKRLEQITTVIVNTLLLCAVTIGWAAMIAYDL